MTNFNTTGFDVEELRRVAEVLAVTNPARCKNVESTMVHIMARARAEVSDKPSYVSTMGWCVTSYYLGGDVSLGIRYHVTLDAWGIAQWIKQNTMNRAEAAHS